MFALLICALLSTTQIDDFCQREYGHPGDLGVTQAAEKYFTGEITYMEAAATIGMRGVEVPSNDASLRVYRWQDGHLEMHFRNQRLTMYRMNGRWRVVNNPAGGAAPQHRAADQISHDQAERRRMYEANYKKVETIIQTGRQVAEGPKERNDIRALQYYLTRFRRAIDTGNWKQADDIWDTMKDLPSLQRSHVVAADAKRRLSLRQRADDERRHRELMKQRERMHRDEMRLRQQQQAIDALRYLRGN